MPPVDQISDAGVKWIEVPPAALRGEGLEPYPEGGTSNLFDWAENPGAQSLHLMPHFGQLIVDVVEIEANAVHQPSKPGDELVVVLNGKLSLTTDGVGTEQIIESGGMVMIPAGWAGIYRVIPGNGHFRELAIVPGNYFDPTAAAPPSGLLPQPLRLPTDNGTHELHRNRYFLEAENREPASHRQINTSGDQIIQVLGGTLTLKSADESARFGPGSVVILPASFSGEAETSAGYRALNLRWID